MSAQKIVRQIAAELQVRPEQVGAAVDLIDGGATVPFIARYRKEATGGLDDAQLRELDERLAYLRELEARRATVLASIAEQGKLTDALRAAVEAAATKQALEDLYLPFKPRRRTKAMIAREAGLEPLADRLFADPTLAPLAEAVAFVDAEAGFADPAAVLDGVRDLLAERWAEDAALVGALREWLWAEGRFASRLVAGKDPAAPDAAKFADYFDYAEPIAAVPSHRALAVLRGRAAQVLDASLIVPDPDAAEGRIARHLGWSHAGRATDDFLRRCVGWTWKVKLALALERDLFVRLREAAEHTAIKVFAANLRDVLLAAPAGGRVVMGLDPGIRTGVKVALVDATGKVLATATVHPHEPRRDKAGALAALERLVLAHGVTLIAIGNGTASRETDRLAAELVQRVRERQPDAPAIEKLVVSEAGASVYSASELASHELPGLDVSLRGAVSIARRVQDPLAELVKIDPKSIGVGQYQHDVNQRELQRTLDAVVEDCVNAVGVDLNTASPALLARVSGLGATVAAGIVRWRDANGAFRDRRQLREVNGLGDKSFEQSAGFLRIRDGDNPLDRSGVHPETYPLVERVIAQAGRPIASLLGADVLRSLHPEALADARFGIVTVKDVLAELEKPGRDPRPDFRVARHAEGVETIADLKPGMTLEGTVSNVAAFGAFVDVGVHQDGLVHVSQLAQRFVADARDIVKTGDIVKVRVLEVDLARGRIALTMKPEARPEPRGDANRFRAAGREQRARERQRAPEPTSAMAAAFAKLQRR